LCNLLPQFYIIQVLESDDGRTYYTWMRWGRVGVSGQNSLFGPYGSAEPAVAAFCSKFKAKTKNTWGVTPYDWYQGKYRLIVMNYDDANAGKSTKKNKNKKKKVDIPESKLSKPVQELVSLICNVNMMKQQMVEIGYDAKKMPLGRLSQEMIREGFEVGLGVASKSQPSSLIVRLPPLVADPERDFCGTEEGTPQSCSA